MAAGKVLARLVRVCCVLAALGYGGYYAYDHVFQPGEIRRRVHDELAANGIAVGLVSKSYSVIRFIQAARLDEILAGYPTIDDALAVFWTDKCALG